MLNDADGHGGGAANEAIKDADALFRRLKRDVKTDYNSKRPSQLAQRGARATVGLHERRDLSR